MQADPVQNNNISKTTWWSQNWKWVIPSTIVTFFLCIVGFVASIMLVMKSSEAYKMAMEEVRSSPISQDVLGTPINDKFFLTGGVNVSSGGKGDAEFVIRIEGPKESAKVYVEAIKQRDNWQFLLLEIQTEFGETIDLLKQ